MRVLIAVVVVGASCRTPAREREDVRRVAREQEVEVIDHPSDALALRAALALTRTKEFGRWIFDLQEDQLGRSPLPAPPRDVVEAVDALVAWDRPGATFEVGCDDMPGTHDAFPALLDVARSALALASSPDDPRLHAVLHLGHALRAPGNGQFAIDVGLGLSLDAALWLERHDATASRAFSTYAPEPEDDLFDRYLRTGKRCAQAIARSWLDAADERGELPDAEQLRAGAVDIRAEALRALDEFCDRAISAQRTAGFPDALTKLRDELDRVRPSSTYLTVASAQCRGDFAGGVLANIRAYAAIIEKRMPRDRALSRSSSPRRPRAGRPRRRRSRS